MSENLAADRANSRQALTFLLGTETYGIDILRVREIRGWTAVTRIPRVPHQVLGILNLRGAVVPIIDLRVQFGLDQAEFTPATVIIVLGVETAEGARDVGIVVDAVAEVIDVNPAQVRATPDLGEKSVTENIQGLLSLDERVVALLDVEHLIGTALNITLAAPAGRAQVTQAA